MDNFEQKYLEQKRKCDNLLKMQTNIFNDVDQYSKSLIKIKNYTLSLSGQQEIDEGQQITPQIASLYSEQIIAFIKKLGKPCQCNRWKQLYQKESQQTLKLAHYNQQLISKIKDKEEQQSKDNQQINQLLNDYLELYKKQCYPPKEIRQEQSKKEKDKKEQNRSKSKSKKKSGISQTERKNLKNISHFEPSEKEQHYIRVIVQKLERDLLNQHKQIQSLRDKNIELEQTIRIYRTKQRKHLLANICPL